MDGYSCGHHASADADKLKRVWSLEKIEKITWANIIEGKCVVPPIFLYS